MVLIQQTLMRRLSRTEGSFCLLGEALLVLLLLRFVCFRLMFLFESSLL